MVTVCEDSCHFLCKRTYFLKTICKFVAPSEEGRIMLFYKKLVYYAIGNFQI